MKEKCQFCGNKNAETTQAPDSEKIFMHCPTCGHYILPLSSIYLIDKKFASEGLKQYDTKKLYTYLFHNKIANRYAFVGTDKAYESYKTQVPYSNAFLVTPETVETWYPKTFQEKIDKILLALGKKSKYFGDPTNYSYLELTPMLFLENTYEKETEENLDVEFELEFILNYFITNEYIVGYSKDTDLWEVVERIYDLPNGDDGLDFPAFTLSAKAWERIYELQKNQTNNKKIFIAMSFNPAIEKTYNAIDLAIRQAKCEVVSLKHRIHNKQIVPEMLRLIKESKMLVMDISEPNFGAYYEAGYAQGLDKEVIITCKSSVMKKEEFLCEDKKGIECELLRKYSKPHFDIAQKQILVWEDELDLTEQLTEWIKFLIG